MKDRMQNRESTSSQISEAMHNLVGVQRQELRSFEVQIPDPDSINLFEWYKKDARFSRTYHQALGYALIPSLNLAGSRSLEDNFAGITFENIAFTVCALKENSNGIIVLSPTGTNQLFKYLYPNARRVDFAFREDLLGDDASVPDGIGIKESDLKHNTIFNIYEYTLSQKREVFDEKYDSFKKKKRNFPKLFATANLVFVLPKSAILPDINGSDIRFMETNFTRSDFRDFMAEVYHKYKVADGIATLREIEGWGKMPSSGDLVNRTMKFFFAAMK